MGRDAATRATRGTFGRGELVLRRTWMVGLVCCLFFLGS
jgi:hypothetical protein